MLRGKEGIMNTSIGNKISINCHNNPKAYLFYDWGYFFSFPVN